MMMLMMMTSLHLNEITHWKLKRFCKMYDTETEQLLGEQRHNGCEQFA